MFESAEIGHCVDKETYDREVPRLREALLTAQYDVLRTAKFPVIIVVGGVDAAGKGETVNLLNEWMDPRHIQVRAYGPPNDEERARPRLWRYWRDLPPKGRTGVFFHGWYGEPLEARVAREIDDDRLDHAMQEIVGFERMLADEGALILKFWFHLARKQQKARIAELESSPKTRWRVTLHDLENVKHYNRFRTVAERALRETSRDRAVWTVVEGADARYRELTVGRALADAMRAQLGVAHAHARAAKPSTHVLPSVSAIDRRRIVDTIDLSLETDDVTYERELEKWQRRLSLLLRSPRYRGVSTVALFEGVDAGGKGGAIRRVASALDARQYRIVPVAAPTEEERAQPYLWRFWRRIPRLGGMTIFDRSWYGRVLVERVEGLCPPAEWSRAYAEINDFEEQLVDAGAVVVKFWLQISKEEQLRRFRERESTPFKRFKITPEDWRNRKKWDAYEDAVCDMVDRTSTEIAPWTLVASEDKRYARVDVLKTLCKRIEARLGE